MSVQDMKKQILVPALGVILLASCADRFDQNFETVRPDKEALYGYLEKYDALKEYVKDNPNFHLGIGTTAADYNKKELVYALTNSNFTETVAGNAMKMASCVSDDGSMDFETVVNYVNNATDAGLSVYGHVLAWHSQQANKWLNSLIADKEIKVDPNQKVEKQDALTDFSQYTSYPFYVMGYTPTFSDGCLHSSNPGGWYQYFVVDKYTSVPGTTYKVTALIKSSKEGKIGVQTGNWGATVAGNMNVSTEWEEQSVEIAGVTTETAFVVLQPGTFDGDLDIKWIKVSHSEAPVTKFYVNQLTNGKMEEGGSMANFVVREPGQSDAEGKILVGQGPDGKNCIAIHSHANPTNNWDTQFFIYTPNKTWTAGEQYKVSFWYKASEEAKTETQCHGAPGSYKYWSMLSPVPTFTTEWQHYESTSTIPADGDGMQSIAFNLNVNKNAVTYYIADVEWSVEKSGNTIPLTDEEKKDTLTYAMDKWIGGMMEATQGKVKAWDVVNEALSGADKDGDGKYDLQSATRGNVSEEDAKNSFYWQDYLGDLDYVRTAVALARKHFVENGGNADELKLFINDYNLESDWDNNGKLKSLIKWIKDWEADGVTKIDGIGSQMHITCYGNAQTQESKKNAIVNMLQLMAESGKLCRISEFDMGYVDANGNKVVTSEMTEAQHKEMRDLYEFVVKKYLEIIPAAQQWGICQWCPTDNNSSSGWRAGEPVGLWDTDYYRKHTYAGFAAGLGAPEYWDDAAE